MIATGQFTTIREIKHQDKARWVVLTDLRKDGGDILGGVVNYITDTKTLAGDKAVELESKGIKTYISCGAFEPICVGDVFAD